MSGTSLELDLSKTGIIIPALNASVGWQEFRTAILSQDVDPSQVLIVDSSSDDNTAELAASSGFLIAQIPRNDFNHGGTRQWAAHFFPEAEILIYLTQDAILVCPNAIENLITAFCDPRVGAAYGRQLPRRGAGPIESHGRLFNYQPESDVRSLEDKARLGLKTIFISNSFAGYRKSALEEVGGFPNDVIFGEDTIVAAKMLLRDWKIAYVADAKVYHSHSYSVVQEFKRYFDVGVLHARESWLIREFGGAHGEGKRYLRSEIKHLIRVSPGLIPSALLRTVAKFGGYCIGKQEAGLDVGLKRRLSMHRGFWR